MKVRSWIHRRCYDGRIDKSFHPAHFIKDKSTKRFKATCALESKYRWCLTGTPIQNRIDDFAALISFLQVHPFDRSFKRSIIDPLKNNNLASVSKLRTLVNSVLLRRTKSSLGQAISLPTRNDHTEYIKFSLNERALYEFAKQQANTLLRGIPGRGNTSKEYLSILQAILRLRQICSHNTDLWPARLRVQFQGSYRVSQGLGQNFFDVLDSCEACGEDINDNPSADVTALCPHILCGTCLTGGVKARSSKDSQNAMNYACPLCFACGFGPEEQDSSTKKTHQRQKQRPDNLQPSSKVNSLIENLRKDQSCQGDCPEKRYAPVTND